MNNCDVYVYGMTILSTIHQLKGAYPVANTYQEITDTFMMPGGEGGNCALVLQNFGYKTVIDACYVGQLTEKPLHQYFAERGVDSSLMTKLDDFPGWRDMVLCDGHTRTVFGWFINYLFSGKKLWTTPSEAHIQAAKCVVLDPFFHEASAQAAELCIKHQKPYITIDCKWDDPIAQRARVLVVSEEFLDREYRDQPYEQVFQSYTNSCDGLVIFTFGSKPLWYGSHGTQQPEKLAAFKIEVVDTLGAGDSFRAGIVHGLLQGMSEREMIRFASATAAVVCTRFPSVHQPPTLQEVEALMRAQAN